MPGYFADVEIGSDRDTWVIARELFNGHWRHVSIEVPTDVKRNYLFETGERCKLQIERLPMTGPHTHKLVSANSLA